MDQARDFLEGRGFTWETVNAARLGVVNEPAEGDEKYRRRLHIPYTTRSGVVYARFRDLMGGPSAFKYLGRAKQEVRLYGVDTLFRASDTVVVTEGELDALTLHQLRIAAVAIPGATIWKPHWGRIFEDFTRILVFSDGDEAGRKFGNNLVERVGASVLELPPGEDINSMYVKHGGDFFHERLL